ncbi:MAG: VOC family protein [Chloroflexota bacterium]|nr:VOC family protein [Chloroflexota bacterium]
MGAMSVLLAVKDMKETLAFYTQVLGFEMGMVFPDAEGPEYADVARDGMQPMFVPCQNVGVGPDERLGVGVNIYLELDGDIDEYYRQVKGRGATVVDDIKDEPFGIRDFTVSDPNGYLLTFNKQLQAG